MPIFHFFPFLKFQFSLLHNLSVAMMNWCCVRFSQVFHSTTITKKNLSIAAIAIKKQTCFRSFPSKFGSSSSSGSINLVGVAFLCDSVFSIGISFDSVKLCSKYCSLFNIANLFSTISRGSFGELQSMSLSWNVNNQFNIQLTYLLKEMFLSWSAVIVDTARHYSAKQYSRTDYYHPNFCSLPAL